MAYSFFSHSLAKLQHINEFSHINLAQITLKGPVMTQVQRGEKTSHRGDLDTEVIRTFDKEVMCDM